MDGGPPSKDFLGPVSGAGAASVPVMPQFGEISRSSRGWLMVRQSPAKMCSRPRERIAGPVERTPLIEAQIRGHAAVAQMRVPADRRRVQAARRDQPAAAAERRGAAARRGRFLVGQSRAGRRHRRAAAGHPGDDRHAGRRAGGEGRGHAREGAEIVFYDRAHRKPRGDRRAARRRRRGATVVPSFDDPHIVAGQGTVGLEILEQLAERAPPPARIVVPSGGGGLCVGDRARLPGSARSSASSPRAGTTCAARSSGARSSRSAPTRRRRCATRCRRRACRRSPSASCASAAREAWRSAKTRSRDAVALRLARASAGGRAGRGGRAGGAAGGQGRARPEDGGGAVGRERRSGAARADRRSGLAVAVRYSPGSRCAGLDRSTAGSAPRARRRASGARRRAPWGRFGEVGRGVEQGVEHHRDARQDRLLDPLERLVEARLLCRQWPWRAILAPTRLSLGEGEREWERLLRRRWRWR